MTDPIRVHKVNAASRGELLQLSFVDEHGNEAAIELPPARLDNLIGYLISLKLRQIGTAVMGSPPSPGQQLSGPPTAAELPPIHVVIGVSVHAMEGQTRLVQLDTTGGCLHRFALSSQLTNQLMAALQGNQTQARH